MSYNGFRFKNAQLWTILDICLIIIFEFLVRRGPPWSEVFGCFLGEDVVGFQKKSSENVPGTKISQ